MHKKGKIVKGGRTRNTDNGAKNYVDTLDKGEGRLYN